MTTLLKTECPIPPYASDFALFFLHGIYHHLTNDISILFYFAFQPPHEDKDYVCFIFCWLPSS